MNIYMRLGVAGLAALTVSGCATVTRGTKQSFTIASQPPGADVVLTTGQTCVTPCKLKLKRNKPFVATFTKKGYQTLDTKVETRVNGGGAMAGNLIAGGLIGMAVDATNGSLNTLDPKALDVTLVPDTAPAAAPAGGK